VAVIGSIQPRSYEDQSGQKRYITEVIVEEIYFADGKRDVNDDYQRQEEGLYDEMSDDPTSLPFDM
jgi:single-strand DNA-binding protein